MNVNYGRSGLPVLMGADPATITKWVLIPAATVGALLVARKMGWIKRRKGKRK